MSYWKKNLVDVPAFITCIQIHLSFKLFLCLHFTFITLNMFVHTSFSFHHSLFRFFPSTLMKRLSLSGLSTTACFDHWLINSLSIFFLVLLFSIFHSWFFQSHSHFSPIHLCFLLNFTVKSLVYWSTRMTNMDHTVNLLKHHMRES